MNFIQGQSDQSKRLHESWAYDLAARYSWDEKADLTFSAPQLNSELALGMFKSWLHTRYLEHAVSVGQATSEIINKIGLDGKQVYKMQGTWVKDPDGYDHLDHWEQTRKMLRHTKYAGPFHNKWKRKNKKLHPVYLVAVEKHKSGAKHLHALIKHRVFEDTLQRVAGWSSWHGQRGYGRIRIEPPADQNDVRSYVTKHYTTKEGDILLSPTFDRKSAN